MTRYHISRSNSTFGVNLIVWARKSLGNIDQLVRHTYLDQIRERGLDMYIWKYLVFRCSGSCRMAEISLGGES